MSINHSNNICYRQVMVTKNCFDIKGFIFTLVLSIIICTNMFYLFYMNQLLLFTQER